MTAASIRNFPAWLTRAFGAVAMAGLATGCIVERQHHVVRDDPPRCTSPGSSAASAWIETDERLEAAPGEGAGVFVEYESGGRWHVWLTCDTSVTGRPCHFDVFAQALGASIGNVVGESLSPGDAVYHDCSDTAQLMTSTRATISGMYFDAPPGATIQLDVLLDGAPYPELVYWYGKHRKGDRSDVRYGAPGNPVAFTPTRP